MSYPRPRVTFVQGEWRVYYHREVRFNDIESPLAATFGDRLMFNALFMYEPKQGSYTGIEHL